MFEKCCEITNTNQINKLVYIIKIIKNRIIVIKNNKFITKLIIGTNFKPIILCFTINSILIKKSPR